MSQDRGEWRKKIEVVCEKHFGVPFVARQEEHIHPEKFIKPGPFIDDLLALIPQPDREELKGMLEVALLPKAKVTKDEILDLITAWAGGEKKKVWCDHIVWQKGTEHFMLLDDYLYRPPYGCDATIWKVCPICSEPRP